MFTLTVLTPFPPGFSVNSLSIATPSVANVTPGVKPMHARPLVYVSRARDKVKVKGLYFNVKFKYKGKTNPENLNPRFRKPVTPRTRKPVPP